MSSSPVPPAQYGIEDASFRAAGGEAGLRRLVEDFYAVMAESPGASRLLAMHPDDLEVSIDKLARFLCGWLGGPSRYREKYGQIFLPLAHRHLPVTPEDRDTWLWCMEQALARQPYEPSFRTYLLRALSVPSERIVTVCAQAQAAGGTTR